MDSTIESVENPQAREELPSTRGKSVEIELVPLRSVQPTQEVGQDAREEVRSELLKIRDTQKDSKMGTKKKMCPVEKHEDKISPQIADFHEEELAFDSTGMLHWQPSVLFESIILVCYANFQNYRVILH